MIGTAMSLSSKKNTSLTMKNKLFFIITSLIFLAGIIVSVIEYFLAKKQEGLNVVGTGSSSTPLPSITQLQLELTANLIDENKALQQKVESLQTIVTNNTENPTFSNQEFDI